MKLQKIPFLKLLLPYTCGVAAVVWIGNFEWQHLVFALCALCLSIGFILQHYSPRALWRPAFMVTAYLFLFFLAFETSWLYQQRHQQTHYTQLLASAQSQVALSVCVDDIPVRTSRFYKLPVQIRGLYQNQSWLPANGKLIVYADTALGIVPRLNQTLIVKGKLTPVQGPSNPYEFDYARFLAERNIDHVLYAKPAQLVFTGTASISWSSFGAWLKSKTIETLRESGLSQEAFAICAALLVGYDDEIESSVMRSFSHSGTLHVLSVSGLHTGVLYALIVAIFGLVDRHERRKTLKCVIVLLSLLLLACITGFAPAVSRAVLMLSLVTIGKAFFREHNTYNTLLASAFILLLLNPYLLKDLGFLLSYFAVFGIMYLSPKLTRLYTPGNRILKWLWESSMLSVAATLFTLPLSLYYFHQFPNWFLLSNLVIIPLSMGVMILALLLICFCKVLCIQSAFAWLINQLTATMLWCSNLSNHSGWGYTDLIPFTAADLVFMALLIILFCMFIERKRYRWFVACACCCMAWICVSIVHVWQSRNSSELVVFKNKTGNSMALRQGYEIRYLGDSLPEQQYARVLSPYLQHRVHRLFSNEQGINFIEAHQQRWLVLAQAIDPAVLDALQPTHLVVDANSLRSLRHYHLDGLHALVATTRNSCRTLAALGEDCRKRGVTFHVLGNDGAWTEEWDNGEIVNE